MVKFAGTNESKGPVLGIGLSRQNCERLLEGDVITLTTDSMAGLPALELLLFAGETDDEIASVLTHGGAIPSDRVYEDKTLAEPFVRPADSAEGAN
jgi:hypothetical protein